MHTKTRAHTLHYSLCSASNLLANVKYGVTRWIIAHANIGVAWLYNVVFTTALVAGSR